MAAYSLTRIRFPGARIVFVPILLTFLLPIEALIVPLYQVVSGLGLSNTLLGIMIPWVASPFGLFQLKQAFEELPVELDDAARIDGAGHIRIFFSIVLPNVKVPMLTLGLITFLFSWNSFLWPLIIVQGSVDPSCSGGDCVAGLADTTAELGRDFCRRDRRYAPPHLAFPVVSEIFHAGHGDERSQGMIHVVNCPAARDLGRLTAAIVRSGGWCCAMFCAETSPGG